MSNAVANEKMKKDIQSDFVRLTNDVKTRSTVQDRITAYSQGLAAMFRSAAGNRDSDLITALAEELHRSSGEFAELCSTVSARSGAGGNGS